MKKILFCLAILFGSLRGFAQTTPTATEKYANFYHLDARQTVAMSKIQAQKEKNLSEVEQYKSTNPALYLRKRQSINSGMNASIERLLTKEQMMIHRKKQAEVRMNRAKKTSEMKNSNASEVEKELLLLELEEQF
jgi:hypothetical protein